MAYWATVLHYSAADELQSVSYVYYAVVKAVCPLRVKAAQHVPAPECDDMLALPV